MKDENFVVDLNKKCPYCNHTDKQSNKGCTTSGNKRYYCSYCRKSYTYLTHLRVNNKLSEKTVSLQLSEDIKKTYRDEQSKQLVDTLLDKHIEPSDTLILICPNCHNTENQIRIGFDKNGNQKCRCKDCNKTYITTIKDITAEPVTKKSDTKWNTSCPKCHNRIWQTISKYYSDGKFGCRCNCCGYEYVENFKQMSTQLETALRALNKLKDRYPETKVTIQYKGQELTVELDEITIFSKDDLNIIFGLK